MQEIKLPEDFLKRMEKDLGEEYPDFLKSYQKKRAYGLRVNTLKVSVKEFCHLSPFSVSPIEWCSTGFYYKEEEHPGKHPFHEAGMYYIQEPSAMAAAELLMPEPGEWVLDLCAAPGGKTSQIAAKLEGKGLLVSNEIHPQRAKVLSQNVERMGISNIVVTNETPERLAKCFPMCFDRIMVDAPCSGEGMFRKEENARAEWSLEQVMLCAKRQKEILEYADQMLRPGGYMVYSTCTFAKEEDEAMIEGFLKGHAEYGIPMHKVSESFVKCHIPGTYKLFPHHLKGEGHFLAILQKGEGQSVKKGVVNFGGHIKEKKVLIDYENFKQQAGLFLEGENYFLLGEQLYLLPEGITGLQGVKVERPGLHLGTLKKNRFEPSHALALAINKERVKNSISFPVGSEQIKDYLHGESIAITEIKEIPENGWCLVLVDGFSIGWGKVTGGFLKNHYPKGLRMNL